jgi:hypothetical protein
MCRWPKVLKGRPQSASSALARYPYYALLCSQSRPFANGIGALADDSHRPPESASVRYCPPVTAGTDRNVS